MSEIEALRCAKEKGFIAVSVFFSDEFSGIDSVIKDVEMDLDNPLLDQMEDYKFTLVGNVITKTKYGMTKAVYELK